jgi:glycosyltransferase involved in cell wall biosynthesis
VRPSGRGARGGQGAAEHRPCVGNWPHFNDYNNLDACLGLLQAQSFLGDRTEIIVADNGSSRGLDAVRRIVGRAAGSSRSLSAAPGRPATRGRATRGEAIAFIDSDCRPDKRWLEEGLAELCLADFTGGRIDVLVDDPRRMTADEAFESVFAFQNERYVKKLNFTVTASIFLWRSAFDAVGGFVNGVPEDKEWCLRAWRQGYRVRFAPEVDRRPSRPPDDAGIEAQMAAVDARIVRRRLARGQGTDPRLVAPMGGPVGGPAARIRAACYDSLEGYSKPSHGDRGPG